MSYRKTRWEVRPGPEPQPVAPAATAIPAATTAAPHVQVREQLLLAVPALLLVVGLIGWRNTPHGADGRPYLLNTTNRGISIYMAQSSHWLASLEEGGRMLGALERFSDSDVFSRSQQAQAAVDKANQLYASVDRARVPPSLAGLQERYRDAANLFVKAAQAGSNWALTQTQEDKARFDDAQTALEAAIETLEQISAQVIGGASA